MDGLTKIFNYEGRQVRTVLVNNEPWFVAKDVCDILNHSNSRVAISRLDEDEKGVSKVYTPGGYQNMSVVNEFGLYSLVLTSNLPEAKQFKRWITHEVIPTIRKTGGYVANDELFVNTYLPFADEQTKLFFSATLETVRKQNEQIAIMKPKVEQHDRFISAENLQTLEQVGKTLGIGRNKLSAFLKAVGVFTQKGGSPIPYQRFINEGYFKVKQTPSRYYEFNNVQTYVTARGVSYIDKILIEHGGAEYINSMRLKDISRFPMKANLA